MGDWMIRMGVCHECQRDFIIEKHGQRFCTKACRSVYLKKLKWQSNNRKKGKRCAICGFNLVVDLHHERDANGNVIETITDEKTLGEALNLGIMLAVKSLKIDRLTFAQQNVINNINEHLYSIGEQNQKQPVQMMNVSKPIINETVSPIEDMPKEKEIIQEK